MTAQKNKQTNTCCSCRRPVLHVCGEAWCHIWPGLLSRCRCAVLPESRYKAECDILTPLITFFDSCSFGVLCCKHCLGGWQHVRMRASVNQETCCMFCACTHPMSAHAHIICLLMSLTTTTHAEWCGTFDPLYVLRMCYACWCLAAARALFTCRVAHPWLFAGRYIARFGVQVQLSQQQISCG